MLGEYKEQGILLISHSNRQKTILVIYTTGEQIELVSRLQITSRGMEERISIE